MPDAYLEVLDDEDTVVALSVSDTADAVELSVAGEAYAVGLDLVDFIEVAEIGVGPRGPAGDTTTKIFEYVMLAEQTTALIAHNLGRDPVVVQVLLDGQICEGYSYTFPTPGQTVLIGFDVSVKATIRLH